MNPASFLDCWEASWEGTQIPYNCPIYNHWLLNRNGKMANFPGLQMYPPHTFFTKGEDCVSSQALIAHNFMDVDSIEKQVLAIYFSILYCGFESWTGCQVDNTSISRSSDPCLLSRNLFPASNWPEPIFYIQSNLLGLNAKQNNLI